MPVDVIVQNPNGSRVSTLLLTIPPTVAELTHVLSTDAERLQEIIAELHLRVTEGRTWRFEALSSGIVYVSNKAVELIWAFAYAHAAVYRHVFSGKQISGDYDAEADDALVLPRAMLKWCLNEEIIDGIEELPDNFPTPLAAAPAATLEGFAWQVALHAVRFHLLHEVGHVYLRDETFPTPLDLERACDLKAVEWMMDREFADESARRLAAVGSAAAMLYVAAYGIDTGRHDGITHPRTYDRLVETLQTQFGPDEDDVWGYATAILSVHATNRGIELAPAATPDGGFLTFFDCVQAFREAIHAHAEEQ